MRCLTRLVALLALAVTTVHAQTFPSKPIKVVVPFSAGGGTDLFARVVAEKMSATLQQPVLIDNRPGAGTNIGAQTVARAEPDGYTLLWSSSATYAINPALYKNLPYDPLKDFAPVGLTGRFTLVLVAGAGFKGSSVQDVIAAARARPAELAYSSPGTTSALRLGMELFLQRAGIQMLHVPYPGAAQAMQDLLGERVQLSMTDMSTSLPHIKSGRMRAIMVASDARSPLLPQTPTGSESGLSGFEASAWQALAAPRGTPPAVIQRLNDALKQALADPDVAARLSANGIEPTASSPDAMAQYLRTEMAKWDAVIKAAQIKPE